MVALIIMRSVRFSRTMLMMTMMRMVMVMMMLLMMMKTNLGGLSCVALMVWPADIQKVWYPEQITILRPRRKCKTRRYNENWLLVHSAQCAYYSRMAPWCDLCCQWAGLMMMIMMIKIMMIALPTTHARHKL